MKPTDNCWGCKHLTSAVYSAPPLFCRAFPDGRGIPFQIIAGTIRHDRLIGGENAPVYFEPRDSHEQS